MKYEKNSPLSCKMFNLKSHRLVVSMYCICQHLSINKCAYFCAQQISGCDWPALSEEGGSYWCGTVSVSGHTGALVKCFRIFWRGGAMRVLHASPVPDVGFIFCNQIRRCVEVSQARLSCV